MREDQQEVYFIKKEPEMKNKTFEYFDGEQWVILSNNQIREQQLHGIWICNYVNNYSVAIRTISTLHTFDVEQAKKDFDDAFIANGYNQVNNGWFFVKN